MATWIKIVSVGSACGSSPHYPVLSDTLLTKGGAGDGHSRSKPYAPLNQALHVRPPPMGLLHEEGLRPLPPTPDCLPIQASARKPAQVSSLLGGLFIFLRPGCFVGGQRFFMFLLAFRGWVDLLIIKCPFAQHSLLCLPCLQYHSPRKMVPPHNQHE
jgi:hypothetical protein